MELIPLFSKILILSMALLCCVLLFSFIFNKTRNAVRSIHELHEKISYKNPTIIENILFEEERRGNRAAPSQQTQIFQIRQFRREGIDFTPQLTLDFRDSQDQDRSAAKYSNPLRLNRKRYTIVNEEMEKIQSNVINF